MTQKAIAQLYNVDRSVVTKHLKNVFESGKLVEHAVCAKFAHTADDGKTYQNKFYSLSCYIKIEQEDVSVDALIRDETIWLTQRAMAELFGIDKSGISRHLKNIFASGELEEEVVVAKIAIPTKHGAIPDKEQLV